ncbi:OmpA family protein [Alteromonas lipolytica]|uniref:OmpA-like domain-containing protein n=1 Tax=Alteromonas lipolytica TaxID=1856405 RepID=A0A1E8F889_9ALTE|nr:OmpA family protein [Alteromonas lipolytica]OFI32130.1 hypothetical protein BFC17_07840 [Alteromonas lipolytica]GGF83641.1 membrane protein [Alteromonas lipolytica]
MKKSSITLALIAAGLISAPTLAQEQDAKDWVGVYGLYYSTDDDKPQPAAQLDDGFGLGIEYGFRFDENWAARASASYLDIDGTNGGSDENGPLIGVDAMYFFQDDLFYAFGGLYYQNLDDDYEMIGYGLGKHWAVDDNLAVISEVAAYRDLSDSYYDYSVKLGVSYTFGSASSYSEPTPAPMTTAAPADSDYDGVIDTLDQCPGTPSGTVVDSKGCNADTDGDGVINSQDQCPNTAAGVAVDGNGCAIEPDSDNDGVLDSKDACPDTPAGDKVHPNGCTIFTAEEVSIEVRILFANNSAAIEDTSDPQIVDLAAFLNRYGKTSAVVEGHSSAPGAAAYNKDLSLRRAKALKAVLVNQYGIDANRLKTVGYGEERLLDTANTKEANHLNRRIEVKISETIEIPAK